MLLVLAVACGDSGNGNPTDAGNTADAANTSDAANGSDAATPTTPSVLASTPLDSASGVPLNGTISATFNEPMDPATLTVTTFTLTSGAGAVPVAGTVLCSGTTAIFRPAPRLAMQTAFTATITTGAKSASGVALGEGHSWSFTTGDSVAPTLPVDLGTAGDFAILAKSGISTVPTSAITGDLGVSPAAATYITGFSLTVDSGNAFSTSTQVTGRVYASDYAVPTPSNLTTAVGDMELAFTDAAGRAADVTELGAGNIGGMTLTQGVYQWGTGLK